MLLILSFIALDVCDRSCDAVALPQPEATIAADRSAPADPCADSCVPDCFCCANPAPAVTVVVVHGYAALAYVPAAPVELLAAGFLPVLDHIPIASA